MATSLPAGAKCHAKFSDGEFYVAEVVEWSTAKKREKAPVKVHYLGYGAEQDAWVTKEDIRSKQLEKPPKEKKEKPAKEAKNGKEAPKEEAKEKPAKKKKGKKGAAKEEAPAPAKEAPAPASGVPSVGTKLQALFEEEKKYYVAEIVAVGVKVHYLGYGTDEDAWLTLDKVRSKAVKAAAKAAAKPAEKAAAPAAPEKMAMPAVGDKLKAKFSDGEMYAAEVVLVSTAQKRKKAPVKVHFVGYGEEEDCWVSLDDCAPAGKGKKKKGKKPAAEKAEKAEAPAKDAPAPKKKARKPRKKPEKKEKEEAAAA
jgi:hypothetical protein